MLTKDEAMKLLAEAELAGKGDPESGHLLADDALCGFLESLGYADLVAAWHKVDKWYA